MPEVKSMKLVFAMLSALVIAATSTIPVFPHEQSNAECNDLTCNVDIIGQDEPYYSSKEIAVKKGATIVFENHDSVMHTVTSTKATYDENNPEEDGRFNSPLLKSGDSYLIQLNEEGEYNYFCQVHPWMRGKVTVIG